MHGCSFWEILIIVLSMLVWLALARGYVYSIMLEHTGWSMSRTKKIRAQYTFWQRLGLGYLLRHTNSKAARRWYIFWLVYAALTAAVVLVYFIPAGETARGYLGDVWLAGMGCLILCAIARSRSKKS